jgi:hypothetical protein
MAQPALRRSSPDDANDGSAGHVSHGRWWWWRRTTAEVEKRGAAAKAANERHAPREEFCKVISALAGAAEKWARYTEKEAKGCGIPGDAVTQIKAESEHLGKIKTQICSAGPAAAAGPPSLSEALGTDRMPIDDGNKATAKRGGVLDSMTGAPVR